MAVEAGARDPGLLDDLGDRVPVLAQMRRPLQLVAVNQHRPPDPAPFAAATARACAARSIAYVRSICANSASSTTASCAIGSSGRLESTLIGSAGCARRSRARTARGSCSACRGPSGRVDQACARRSRRPRARTRAPRAARADRPSRRTSCRRRSACGRCPASASASIWRSRSCLAVDTRAYPSSTTANVPDVADVRPKRDGFSGSTCGTC